MRAILSESTTALQDHGSLVLDLGLIIFFIFVNAFFAASEMAIVTQNDNRIKKMADEGDPKAKKLMRFVLNKTRLLSTIQVLITLAGFLSSAFAADKIAPRLFWALDPSGSLRWLQTFLLIFVTILLSFFSLIFGELVPKRLAMRKPEQFSLAVAGTLCLFDSMLKPVTWFLEACCNLVLRLLGINPHEQSDAKTEEEIRILAEAGVDSGSLGAKDAQMIKNIFAFNDKEVSEIMTPRIAITSIESDLSYSEAFEKIASTSFSRFPVVEDDLDNIVGFLFAKDLLRVPKAQRASARVRDIMRKPYFVPEGKMTNVLFQEMQTKHLSMVVIIDEYGGTEGIITMEDLMEEIFGDIEDEYDKPRDDVKKNPDGSFEIDGMMTPAEAGEYIAALAAMNDDDAYDTVAGFVLSLLGYIPQADEHPTVKFRNLTFTVLEMADKRIAKIKVEVAPEASLHAAAGNI